MGYTILMLLLNASTCKLNNDYLDELLEKLPKEKNLSFLSLPFKVYISLKHI